MKIHVIGHGAIGTLVGGLLLSKNHTVSFEPNPQSGQTKEDRYLRIILPDRWLRIDHIQMNPANKPEICFFSLKRSQYASITVDQMKKNTTGNSESTVFFNCDNDDIKHLVHDNLSHSIALTLLTSVSLQPQDVELSTSDSYLVYEKEKTLKEIFFPLKDFGIKSFAVDSVTPYANSFFLYQLLFLPVAMCNTTLGYFLSFKEGRELALRILHEGLKTFTKNETPLGKLPVMDPVELINKLEKKPDKYEHERYKCDRAYNTVLQSFLLNKKNEVNRLNGKLITLSKNAGVDPVWNWKLVQKVQRVTKFGFYPNPKELLGGID